MKAKASTIAQKLLNLYRQEHVIFGGWAAVNPVFVEEASEEVMKELEQLPNGKVLIQHINNLRNGKTPMDAIDRELLPYGGMMAQTVATIPLTNSEWEELEKGINGFTPDENGLKKLQELSVIKKFGDEWLVAIRSSLSSKPELLQKWSVITKTYRAYYLWKLANDILTQPLSERSQAQVQSDMPEYETYLPMFGQTGEELLNKLRKLISTSGPEE